MITMMMMMIYDDPPWPHPLEWSLRSISSTGENLTQEVRSSDWEVLTHIVGIITPQISPSIPGVAFAILQYCNKIKLLNQLNL